MKVTPKEALKVLSQTLATHSEQGPDNRRIDGRHFLNAPESDCHRKQIRKPINNWRIYGH